MSTQFKISNYFSLIVIGLGIAITSGIFIGSSSYSILVSSLDSHGQTQLRSSPQSYSVSHSLVLPQVLGTHTSSFLPQDSLIKASFPTIYYYASDGYRYVFPNNKTFGS